MRRALGILVILVLFSAFGTRVKAANMVEVSSLKGGNICISSSALRIYNSQIVEYGPVVFRISDQIQYPGTLFVNQDVKCFNDFPSIDWKKYRYIYWYYHFPKLWDLRNYLSVHKTSIPYCQAKEVGVAVLKNWGAIQNQNWEEKSYTKVVLFLPTQSFVDLPVPSFPSATGVFVSKDIKCFRTLKEAEVGGFRLISW